MATVTAADRTRYRASLTRTLVESVTIVRTSASVLCRVSDGLKHDIIEGLPRFATFWRYRVVLPAGTDVQMGDHLTISGRPALYVVEVTINRDDGASVHAACIAPSELLTTQSVVFQHQRAGGSPLTIPSTPVLVYQTKQDPYLMQFNAGYDWLIAWQAGLAYSDASHPSAGDFVQWSGFHGGHVTLQQPRQVMGFLPILVAYAREVT
jgi:hypothetical protein